MLKLMCSSSCTSYQNHVIHSSFIIKIHEVKKTDKTFLFRVLQITLLQKNTLQNWDSEFGYYIIYIISYKIWDVVLRQRDTEKRAETETELKREERRASRLAPSTRQPTRHQAHPHTPVGPQISRSEVRASGGHQTNLTFYNKCLNVNLTFYELITPKTIFVKLCRFLSILSKIDVKKVYIFCVLSVGKCLWQAVKTATGYKLILANFIFLENNF